MRSGVRLVSAGMPALFVVVRWLIVARKAERFSVVTISLTEHGFFWRKYPSAKAARAALADLYRKPTAKPGLFRSECRGRCVDHAGDSRLTRCVFYGSLRRRSVESIDEDGAVWPVGQAASMGSPVTC